MGALYGYGGAPRMQPPPNGFSRPLYPRSPGRSLGDGKHKLPRDRAIRHVDAKRSIGNLEVDPTCRIRKIRSGRLEPKGKGTRRLFTNANTKDAARIVGGTIQGVIEAVLAVLRCGHGRPEPGFESALLVVLVFDRHGDGENARHVTVGLPLVALVAVLS